MAAKRDYYEVLGVAVAATDGQISSAYRKLAIRYHPDSHQGDEEATHRFKEAAEAYEVLSDTGKRQRYDRYGHAGLQGAAGGGAGFRDAEDIFDAFGDIFGFGDVFGGRGRRSRRRRGADVQCEVTLDLIEAARGCRKNLEFARHEQCGTCSGNGSRPGSQPQPCPRCKGKGQVVQSAGILRVQTTCPTCRGNGQVITDPCGDCRGSGMESSDVEIEVAIPAGVDEGMHVRLNGEGQPSPDGGPPGDCYCLIHIRPHPLFQREEQHLFLSIPITYTQAVLGTEIEVPTLEGRQTLRIPSGTESGHLFHLRGQGMADPRGGPQGDLIVRTAIEIPQKLDRQQETLLRQLAELEQKHVSPQRKTFVEKIKKYFTHQEQNGQDV